MLLWSWYWLDIDAANNYPVATIRFFFHEIAGFFCLFVFLGIRPQRSANKPIRFRHSIGCPTLSWRLGNTFMIYLIKWMKCYLLGTIHLTVNHYWLTRFLRYYKCSLIFSLITTRNDRAYPFSCHSRKLLRLACSYSCDVSQLEKRMQILAPYRGFRREQSDFFHRFMCPIPTFYLKAD